MEKTSKTTKPTSPESTHEEGYFSPIDEVVHLEDRPVVLVDSKPAKPISRFSGVVVHILNGKPIKDFDDPEVRVYFG